MTTPFDTDGTTIADMSELLLTGPTSVPKLIQELKSSAQYKDNPMLKVLIPIISKGKGKDSIKPETGSLDTLLSNELTYKGWLELFNVDYKGINIGEALIYVALLQDGFNASPMNFLSLAPAQKYAELVQIVLENSKAVEDNMADYYTAFWAANSNDKQLIGRKATLFPFFGQQILKNEYLKTPNSELKKLREKGTKIYNNIPRLKYAAQSSTGESSTITLSKFYGDRNFEENQSGTFYGTPSYFEFLKEVNALPVTPYQALNELNILPDIEEMDELGIDENSDNTVITDEKTSDSFYKGDILPTENTIFVFGSNPEGRHGLGAAKLAKEKFGAIYGQGEGLQGKSYALPTKDLRVKKNSGFKSISPDKITDNIKKLYSVALQNPTKEFKIGYRNTTEKSLNGYTGLEMIEMFNNAGIPPSNILFSEEWVKTNKLTFSTITDGKTAIFVDNENNNDFIVKPDVKELFASNPELANAVYEVAGFSNLLSLEAILKEYTIEELKQGVTLRSLQNKIEEKDFETIKRAYNYLKSEEKYRHIKNSNEQIESKLEELREELRQAKETKVGSVLTIINDDNNSEYKVRVIEINKYSDYAILKVKTAKNKEYTIRVESDGSTKTGFIEDFVFKATDTIDTEAIKSEINNLKSQLQELKSDYSDYYIDYFENHNQISPQQKQQAQQLYSQYLNTIFPNSKVKDVVYHGSKNEFEVFSKEHIGKNLTGETDSFSFSSSKIVAETYRDSFSTGENTIELAQSFFEDNADILFKEGTNFSKDSKIALEGIKKLYPDLTSYESIEKQKQKQLEFISLFDTPTLYLSILDIKTPVIRDAKGQSKVEFKDELSKLSDLKNYDARIIKNINDWGLADLYQVFNPEQIHILGSKQDIEGFKEFIKTSENLLDDEENSTIFVDNQTNTALDRDKVWEANKDILVAKGISREDLDGESDASIENLIKC